MVEDKKRFIVNKSREAIKFMFLDHSKKALFALCKK